MPDCGPLADLAEQITTRRGRKWGSDSAPSYYRRARMIRRTSRSKTLSAASSRRSSFLQKSSPLSQGKSTLRILGMGLDTATANGRLMLNVLGSVAQFEREVMLERQREGIAKAKAEGKFKGRAPTARRKAEEVRAMATAGMTRQVIAGKLGMSERSVYRVLAG